jgi:ubiquitin-protein ligase
MSVSKEFHRLLKRVRKLTDGQASISDIDWDDGNLSKFYVTIIPNNGLYKSGNFKFRVSRLLLTFLSHSQ